MGVAVGDITGDGRWDIFVTNFAEDFSTLYQAIGGGLFEDVSRETGIGPLTYRPLSWGTASVDLDNDGDLDIVVMNGHIYPQIDRHPEFVGTYEQQNLLAENRGAGAAPLFRDATNEAGPGFASPCVEPRARRRRLRQRRRSRPAGHAPGSVRRACCATTARADRG